MTPRFHLRQFDLNQMVTNPSILMLGKRGSGKSFLIKHLVNYFHYHRRVPGGAVISPTERMNSFYKWFFPDSYIHNDAKDETLKKILTRQSCMIEKEKQNKRNDIIDPELDAAGLLVMDDCLTKKSWAKDESVTEILMNGRHYKLTYVLTTQTPYGITPDLRLNFDYVFLFREDSTINKRRLWDMYASMFPDFETFEPVFDECTRDYGVMVIDNRRPSDSIADKVFWFKAQEFTNFVFGCQKFQQLHEERYDPNYMRRSNQIFLQNGAKNKNTDDYVKLSDDEYMFYSFANEDKLKENCIVHANQDVKPEFCIDSNYDSESDTEYSIDDQRSTTNDTPESENIVTNPTSSGEFLQMAYKDDTYQLAVKINNLDNRKLIKIFCNHIEKMKLLNSK